MSAAPAFSVSEVAPGALGFAQAVVRRFDARTLAIGGTIVCALVALAGFGLVGAYWVVPLLSPTRIARLFHTAIAGAVVFVAVIAADEAVERGTPRLLTYALAVTSGSVIGSLLGWGLRQAIGLEREVFMSSYPNAGFATIRRIDMVLICMLVGGLATFAHVKARTAMAARRRQHEAERARERAKRRTVESRLQALQARVEPVFLFGTLDRIRDLYRSDAAVAGAMLEDLIAYLRAVLPHLRESSSTVAQEATLVRAWLDIVARSLPGLAVEVELDGAAAAARLPALVLLPLVQHAVGSAAKNPLRLRLNASTRSTADAARLRIDLWTDGPAFAGGIQGQALLEQIAERLAALYGSAAHLSTDDADAAAGSSAHIEMPLEPAEIHPEVLP